MPNPLLRDRQLDTDVQRPNLAQNAGFEVWPTDTSLTRTGDGSATTWFFACPGWQYCALNTSSLVVRKDTVNKDAGSAVAAACTFTYGNAWGDLVQSTQYTIGTTQAQNDPHLEQVLAGKTVTLSVRVRTSTPNSVFPVILDGTNWQRGAAHTGDGTWQTLTRTVTLGPTPSSAGFAWGVVFDNNSCVAYVDNVALVEGSIPLDYRAPSAYVDQIPNFALSSDVLRYNLLTNGGFEVWQRGNGPFTGGNAGPDRWGFNVSGGSTLSVQRSPVPGMTPCPEGKTTVGANLTFTPSGANPYGGLVQNLNDPGASGITNYNMVGQYVSFSAWVWCDAAAAQAHLEINGIGTGIGRSVVHPGNSTWQWLTVTWQISAYPSVGIFMNGAGHAYIDNAMCVPGIIPSQFIPLHPYEDLARCQRYYEVLGWQYDLVMQYYAPGAGQASYQTFPFKVNKCASPTCTRMGTWTTTNMTAVPNVDASTPWACRISGTSSGAGAFSANNSNAGSGIIAEANP